MKVEVEEVALNLKWCGGEVSKRKKLRKSEEEKVPTQEQGNVKEEDTLKATMKL